MAPFGATSMIATRTLGWTTLTLLVTVIGSPSLYSGLSAATVLVAAWADAEVVMQLKGWNLPAVQSTLMKAFSKLSCYRHFRRIDYKNNPDLPERQIRSKNTGAC